MYTHDMPDIPDAPARTNAGAVNWSWVPIRSLGERHRDRISSHLCALDDQDRYLRFGHRATDTQISRYVDTLDFGHDEIFGIFNRRVRLIAMAHLAHGSPGRAGAASEFGVSVLAQARNRGFGRRLFEHAMLHARNRGIDSLFIHALSENTAMLKIARHAGATIERTGSESEAWLKLPPHSFATQVGELFEQQAAELDYRLKVCAQRADKRLDPALAEVIASPPEKKRSAEQ